MAVTASLNSATVVVTTEQAADIISAAEQGATGPTGAAATIAVGTVTELAPGDAPTITNSGTSADATLDFGIPAASIAALQNDTQPISVTDGAFSGTITQTPGQGANNSSPMVQYEDIFQDAITSGLTTTTSATLTGTLAAGVAYVLGQRVAYAGGSYTVGASATSYLDLSNTGVLTVSTSGTVTANSLRLWEVVSSATAITSVTLLAPNAPSLARTIFQAINAYYNANPITSITTATTGGTIAASVTTYYYAVLTTGANTPLAPPTAVYIKSITTGSSTATNANTLNFPAAGTGNFYTIYSSASNTLLSMQAIGTTSAADTSFVDTGLSGSAYMLGITSALVTQNIPLPTITEDTMGAWDAATQKYTVPITGRWAIQWSIVAWSGNAGSSVSLIFGPNSIGQEWNTIGFSGAPAYFPTYRSSRIETMNAGDTLDLQAEGRGTTGQFTNIEVSLLYLGR